MSAWDIHSVIAPSRLHRRIGAAACAMAVLGVVFAAVPVVLQAGLLLLLAIGVWISRRAWRLDSSDTVRELHWTDESIHVVTFAGQRLRVAIHRPTVHARMVILPLAARDGEWRDTLLLFPDSLPREQWRRLQARLRLDRRKDRTSAGMM